MHRRPFSKVLELMRKRLLNHFFHRTDGMELNAFFYVVGDFFEVADVRGGDNNLLDAVAAGGDGFFL